MADPFERFDRSGPILPLEEQEGTEDERSRGKAEGNEYRSAMGNLHLWTLWPNVPGRGDSLIGRFRRRWVSPVGTENGSLPCGLWLLPFSDALPCGIFPPCQTRPLRVKKTSPSTT